MACEALCRGPLMQTRRAHTARIERIPDVTARTHPAVLFAWLPAAQRATDLRARRLVAFFLVDLFARLDRGFCRVFNCAAHNRPIMDELTRRTVHTFLRQLGSQAES